jgi:hypothetical protein
VEETKYYSVPKLWFPGCSINVTPKWRLLTMRKLLMTAGAVLLAIPAFAAPPPPPVHVTSTSTSSAALAFATRQTGTAGGAVSAAATNTAFGELQSFPGFTTALQATTGSQSAASGFAISGTLGNAAVVTQGSASASGTGTVSH